MRTYIIGNDGIALCRKTPAKPVKAPPLLNCAFSNVQLHKDVGDCCLGEKRCNRDRDHSSCERGRPFQFYDHALILSG